MHLKNRNKVRQTLEDVKEDTPDLVDQLILKLESAAEVIEDLKFVLDEVKIEYDVRRIEGFT